MTVSLSIPWVDHRPYVFSLPPQWLGWFGNSEEAGGWTSYDSYPRVLGDVDGDGKEDIIGFKDEGVWVSLSAGDRFLPPTLWMDAYSEDAGVWDDFDTYPRMAGDLNGNGRVEFIGCYTNGVKVTTHESFLGFAYHPDGAMVAATTVISGSSLTTDTTIYIGDHQEWTDGVATNYYFHNGRRGGRQNAGFASILLGEWAKPIRTRTGSDVSYLHSVKQIGQRPICRRHTDTTGDDDSGPCRRP